MSNPLKIFTHHGTKYVDGLFQMMDQEGFPLADSLNQCVKHNLVPCLQQFQADALRAGWTREKITQVIAMAKVDSGYSFTI